MASLATMEPPVEGVFHTELNTEAYIKEQCVGMGTLFITENYVCWINGENKGFVLNYPEISLHAVSRDVEAFHKPCIYLLTETRLCDDEPETDVVADEEEDDGYDGMQVTEVRFCPPTVDSLNVVFNFMSDGQALHPDPEDSDDSDTEFGQGDFFYGEEGFEHLTAQGQGALEHLEAMLANANAQDGENGAEEYGDNSGGGGDYTMEPGDQQFEDADMER